MITIEHDRADYIVCRVSGVLTRADYRAALPELENAMELRPGRDRMLVVLEDFRGWEAGALWEELKFDLAHRRDFARIAVVGDSTAAAWGTRLAGLVFAGEVRFFDTGADTGAETGLVSGADSRMDHGAAQRAKAWLAAAAAAG